MSEQFWQERRTSNNNSGRDPYERDYARIIHSAAFRRLQTKTQVLGLGESDFYRTRLTHSMEVAQIGDAIVNTLRKLMENEKIDQYGLKIKHLPPSHLIQSICLAHDLGHPPFGLGGEIALNKCMLNHGGFEGNGQTLRILTKLEKYTEKNGLDPTRRMILGILKYPASYKKTVNKKRYPTKEEISKISPSWNFQASSFTPPKCYLNTEKEIVQEWILSGKLSEDKNIFTDIISLEEGKHKKTRSC